MQSTKNYPIATVILAYTVFGGLLGGLLIGAIILICTLGFGFFIAFFAVIYGVFLGTIPAFLTGLYLSLKRFKIINDVGWGTVFWVAYFNSLVCLSITFMMMNNIVSPISQIILASVSAIFGGCSSCIIGNKVLPRITTEK